MSDPRFELIDAFDRKWLKLKDGASIDHETEPSITVTVTATDGGEPSASTSTEVTITVTNVNEAPVSTGDAIPAVIGTAGEPLEGAEVNLLSAFSDPDGDTPARYTVSGAPSWLTFGVQFGEDDDGSPTVTGLFNGTPPAGTDTSHTITITAIDAGGLEASTSVQVVIDDGNDDITAVDLLDDDGNVTVDAEVDENDKSGPSLGEIRVTDPDDLGHPNGIHLIEVLKADVEDPDSPKADEDDRFEVRYDDKGVPWLALREGESLNHETSSGGSVDIIIRAVDLNGATNAKGDEFKGNIEHKTITVFANDRNDDPEAQTIGNWWVTVSDDLDAETIGKGSWLTFELENEADDDKYPAFKNPDLGDTLTYSLSGPSILEIDPRDGVITNAKGALPIEGNHRFTVTATDEEDRSDEAHFYVAIALSDGDDGNDEPDFSTPRELDYVENSGDGTVVATFTVTDGDNALGHHPFALDEVVITQLVVGFQDDDQESRTINVITPPSDADQAAADREYIAAFELSEPRKSGNAWTYDLLVVDTDPGQEDSTEILDHETIDTVEVTVAARERGEAEVTASTATETIDVEIKNVNEKPYVEGVTSSKPKGDLFDMQLRHNSLEQSEGDTVTLFINLEDLWKDDADDPDDLIFDADASSTSWIRILNGPVQWDDISDTVSWPSSPSATGTNRVVADEGFTTPGDRDNTWVVIVEIDRTGGNNGQGDRGSFTLTARDKEGMEDELTVTVTPMDQNLPAPKDAVTIAGSPREGATLRANFNDDRDPDLRGDAEPALVLYRWFRDTVSDTGEVTQDGDPFLVSTDSTYKLTQADVDDVIRVEVQHYELLSSSQFDQGQLVSANMPTADGAEPIVISDSTSQAVSNTPDAGTGSITILANGSGDHDGELSVDPVRSVFVTDGDYVDRDASPPNPFGVVRDDDISISWQVSDNGRGGWRTVEGAGPNDGDGDHETLDLDDGQGKWYRAVASYDADTDDDAETESVYSDPIQVSDINDRGQAQPSVDGNAFPDGTLTVDAGGATVDVQWQVREGNDTTGNWLDIDGATGSSLALTQANAGDVIRAVVSYRSKDSDNPGVTAIVATGARTVSGDRSGDGADPVKVKDHDIEVSVGGTGYHPLASVVPAFAIVNRAGSNLSHTEEIDLASLFQDPDSARLYFTVSPGDGDGDDGAGASGLGTPMPEPATGGTYVWAGGAAAGGVLVFEVDGHTAKLTFISDVYRTHDGDGTDGLGNVIRLNINASDDPTTPAGVDSDTAAMVDFRINVAPTGITFADHSGDSNDSDGTAVPVPAGSNAIVNEHVGNNKAGDNGQEIATLDVQDQNLAGSNAGGTVVRGHKFGVHEVEISGDDRFMVTHSGYTAKPNSRDDDGDGSTWEVRLKPGEKLDYETQVDMDPTTPDTKEIVLTVKATDGGGLSTPPGARNEIKLTITLRDVVAGDRNHPAPEQDVPGLKDDEGTEGTSDPDDRTDIDDGEIGADGDDDGGANPPMDTMMMSTLDDGLF